MMTGRDDHPQAILCIASFFKGNDFIREAKRQGTQVVLLTREKLLKEDWARESLDDVFGIPARTTVQAYLMAASQIARRLRVSRVVALEEYDIVTAAQIREHLGLPGMGTTTARRFQDKLAMRVRAAEANIPQPEFVQLLNYEVLDEFMKRVSPPWMLKPRVGASAMGIWKLNEAEKVWRAIRELDAREAFHEHAAFHLIERYLPGAVYHVDALVEGGRILFSSVEQYGTPPFDIAHGGGVTTSQITPHRSEERRRLLALNKKLLKVFGFEHGVTHAEFIRSPERAGPADPDDGFYFLEVAARVGGAYTAETIAAASGINLWREWAKIEAATPARPYVPPSKRVKGTAALPSRWRGRNIRTLPATTIPRSSTA
jgi:biotin carboxylase